MIIRSQKLIKLKKIIFQTAQMTKARETTQIYNYHIMLATYLEITSGISLWSSVRILWAWKEIKFSTVPPKKPRTFSDFWNWQSVWSLQHNAVSTTGYQFHDGYWFHDVKEYVKPQTRELASKRCLNLVFHHILSSSSSFFFFLSFFLSLYNHSVQLQQFEDSIRHFQCVLGYFCVFLSLPPPPPPHPFPNQIYSV